MSYLDVNFSAKFHLKCLAAAAAAPVAAVVLQDELRYFADVNFPG